MPKKFQGNKDSEIEISDNGEGKVTNHSVSFFQWQFNHDRRIIEWKEHNETYWHEWGRGKEECLALYEVVSIWVIEDNIFGGNNE